MGYQAPLDLPARDDGQWIGEHRPELIDLQPIFQRVVDLDLAALLPGMASAAEAWRAALPGDVHIIRMLSERAVHVHAPRAAAVRDLVIKLYLPHADRKWRRLTERMERSRSHRAHLWGHRLRAIGIDTPRPLGFIERSEKPSRHPSFAATEYVLAPTLVQLKDTGMSMLRAPNATAAILEKRALIERLAAVFRAMHGHGMFLGVLSPSTFLIAGREVMVADVDAMREAFRKGRAAVDGLVALHKTFGGAPVTKTDRLRFLTTYLRHEADRKSRLRALWSEIFDKSMMRA